MLNMPLFKNPHQMNLILYSSKIHMRVQISKDEELVIWGKILGKLADIFLWGKGGI